MGSASGVVDNKVAKSFCDFMNMENILFRLLTEYDRKGVRQVLLVGNKTSADDLVIW